MATFQKLLSEAAAAGKLAKRQKELDELQKAAAKRFEMETAARNHFSGMDPAGGLRLYHGTPFDFERFDFEGNLKRGEGALSFGPGGYMTGNEPLAREYAKNLFAKHASPPRADDFPSSVPTRQALATDPKATAQYLRAIQVGKLLDARVSDGSEARTMRFAEQPPPSLRGAQPNFPAPHATSWNKNPSPLYGIGSRITASGIDDYVRLAESVGLPPQKQPYRIGRGGISPLEMVRRGKELERAMGGNPGIRPRLTERLELPQDLNRNVPEWDARTEYIDSRGGHGFSLPGLNQNRANLNSTWRFLNNRPGNAGYTSNMNSGARIDLRDPRPPGAKETWVPPQGLARRLYEAPYEGRIEDMLPYDYPLSAASPRVIGALTRLGEQHGFLDKLHMGLSGSDALSIAQKAIGKDPLTQMRALKEAGLPGHFFLRGGRRSDMTPPDRFTPDDYNYVIFDQNVVGAPKKTKFGSGGSV